MQNEDLEDINWNKRKKKEKELLQKFGSLSGQEKESISERKNPIDFDKGDLSKKPLFFGIMSIIMVPLLTIVFVSILFSLDITTYTKTEGYVTYKVEQYNVTALFIWLIVQFSGLILGVIGLIEARKAETMISYERAGFICSIIGIIENISILIAIIIFISASSIDPEDLIDLMQNFI